MELYQKKKVIALDGVLCDSADSEEIHRPGLTTRIKMDFCGPTAPAPGAASVFLTYRGTGPSTLPRGFCYSQMNGDEQAGGLEKP
jgi:hypothetical protein